MVLLSHPTGNTFSRALLAALQRANLLGQFATSVAVSDANGLLPRLPAAWQRELLRRSFDVPASKLRTTPWREWGRMTALRLGWDFLTRHERGPLCLEAVYDDVDRLAASLVADRSKVADLTAVYCYEDAAARTFEAAQRLGLKRVYDLPIAHWETSQRLLEEERARWPEWRITLEAAEDSLQKLDRKTLELELSDLVICPSRFVEESLPSATRAGKRCVVAEFGSPASRRLESAALRDQTAPLRILFAGSMTQRKGLADVFAAMKLVNRPDVQLVVFGAPAAPMRFYREAHADFIHEGPRPNAEVIRLMETCHVLVLPSIVEGRALVQQEAMSCGLPLIITPNTGGEDLIVPGRTGFLVPIRSPAAIAEKIHWFADHRAELEAMREPVRLKAAELTWSAYTDKIIAALQD